MFFFLPIGMNYRTGRFPIVTLSLIGLNILIYLVSLFYSFKTDGESDLWILHHLWLTPVKSYWWSYLTSMFVHGGILHLAGNMIFLFLFGSCVEDMIGRWRFLIFYLVAGYVAEMTYIATMHAHFLSPVPMGGASGAISGCMAMYLLLRADVDVEFAYFFWIVIFVRAGKFEMPAWMAIVFWFLRDFIYTLIGLGHHVRGDNVAHGDHVGGFIGGLALLAVYKWHVLPREPKEEPELIINPAAAIAAANDARDMASDETPTIFVHDGQEQTGPFTLSQIQVKLRRGDIPRDAQYWSEGMSDWQSVLELAGHPTE